MRDKVKHLKSVKEWKVKHPDKVKQYSKTSRIRNSEYYRKYMRGYQRKLRAKCIEAYGGKEPKCACCGEKEEQFLTFDHIDNNGSEHRRQIKGGNIYQWMVKNSFPKGFQLLCYNCNCSKGFYGECPHNKT